MSMLYDILQRFGYVTSMVTNSMKDCRFHPPRYSVVLRPDSNHDWSAHVFEYTYVLSASSLNLSELTRKVVKV
jgi:hypothetical protein